MVRPYSDLLRRNLWEQDPRYPCCSQVPLVVLRELALCQAKRWVGATLKPSPVTVSVLPGGHGQNVSPGWTFLGEKRWRRGWTGARNASCSKTQDWKGWWWGGGPSNTYRYMIIRGQVTRFSLPPLGTSAAFYKELALIETSRKSRADLEFIHWFMQARMPSLPIRHLSDSC